MRERSGTVWEVGSGDLDDIQPLLSLSLLACKIKGCLAMVTHKMEPVNIPSGTGEELMRPHRWLWGYWQLMAAEEWRSSLL